MLAGVGRGGLAGEGVEGEGEGEGRDGEEEGCRDVVEGGRVEVVGEGGGGGGEGGGGEVGVGVLG